MLIYPNLVHFYTAYTFTIFFWLSYSVNYSRKSTGMSGKVNLKEALIICMQELGRQHVLDTFEKDYTWSDLVHKLRRYFQIKVAIQAEGGQLMVTIKYRLCKYCNVLYKTKSSFQNEFIRKKKTSCNSFKIDKVRIGLSIQKLTIFTKREHFIGHSRYQNHRHQ